MSKNRIQEGQASAYLRASESEARARTEQRVCGENALWCHRDRVTCSRCCEPEEAVPKSTQDGLGWLEDPKSPKRQLFFDWIWRMNRHLPGRQAEWWTMKGVNCFTKTWRSWEFLVVQWLRLGAFTALTWVLFLVGKLRSHKPHGRGQKNTEKKKQNYEDLEI